MGLLTQTQQRYYTNRKTFTGDGSTTNFLITPTQSASSNNLPLEVYVDGNLTITTVQATFPGAFAYSYTYTVGTGWEIIFTTAPTSDATITVIIDTNLGGYQFLSVDTIVSQFLVSYVGEGKIIPKVKRTDVMFHAKRALQELSYDTLKSFKSLELTVPSSLLVALPQDYVNYTKIAWTDDNGIERRIYPTAHTSNPFNPKQNSDGSFSFDIDDDTNDPVQDDTTSLIPQENSDTLESFNNITSSSDDSYDATYYDLAVGQRYGLSPQHAQNNGSFFIDEAKGTIHFGSNISGKTVIIKYISDSLATDDEMIIHKFAEEAVYKWIAYAIVSTKINIPEYIVNRFKKERFATTRKAKLRLSNIKLEELTRILRGKSKQIKH